LRELADVPAEPVQAGVSVMRRLLELLAGQNRRLPRTAFLQVTRSFCISLASNL